MRPLAADPWDLETRDYPHRALGSDQLRFLLRFAILAPSTHNTQPWRFCLIDDDTVEVWADRDRSLPRIDPMGRQMLMSCGAALFHLRIGLRRFGSAEAVEYLPDRARPDLLARVRRGGRLRSPVRDLELFDAIPRRHTNRGAFAAVPVAQDLADAMTREAAAEGAWLARLHPHDKLEVALAVADADRMQFGDPVFRREMARWLAPRGSDRRDGIPMVKKDLPSSMPVAGPALLCWLDLGDGIATREQELATRSPMLAVLGTDLDEPRDWITAGEAMEAVLLRATYLGLSASFLNQAIEEPALRLQIGRAAHHQGHAQLVLRFGWGGPQTPTPRRELEDVVEVVGPVVEPPQQA